MINIKGDEAHDDISLFEINNFSQNLIGAIIKKNHTVYYKKRNLPCNTVFSTCCLPF